VGIKMISPFVLGNRTVSIPTKQMFGRHQDKFDLTSDIDLWYLIDFAWVSIDLD